MADYAFWPGPGHGFWLGDYVLIVVEGVHPLSGRIGRIDSYDDGPGDYLVTVALADGSEMKVWMLPRELRRLSLLEVLAVTARGPTSQEGGGD